MKNVSFLLAVALAACATDLPESTSSVEDTLLTPAQIDSALARRTARRATATPLPGYAEWEVGAGYVDALAAVTAIP